MTLDPQRVKSVFLAVLEKAGPERRALLDEACGGDLDLRRRVERLLLAHERPDSLPEPEEVLGPTQDSSRAGAPEQTPGAALPGLSTGVAVGPYKLVQELGEGGMGTVYMAQQTEPVKRLVALKVIKPGMDSRQVIARFEAERQALALMDHPNIARVLDAGTTEGGRPYFVMELVKGVSITRYCDERRLTPRQRLELFIPVCQAVQHAHQKGVIHRDLKPSNVLVCLYDGRPVPKVIDFGIAKATGQQLTEHTLVTGFGTVVGTLEYMSPEQAELNQLDIDTRSDVYSLGVLLYELLTGTTPLEKKRLKEAAMLEVLRLIREEEPPRPSTRLSESKDALPSISAQRQTDPAKLTRLLRGELDWIALKALEKDRSRRYETANGLALDIQRYLADEPVLACPPSAGYRLRKLVRRNKASFTAATLVALSLVVSSAVSTWQAVEATNARNAERTLNLALDVAREEKDQQRFRTNRELSDALVEAARLQEKVRAARGRDAAATNHLRATLGRAQTLATNEWADPVLAERARALHKELMQEEKDRAMVERIEEIRLGKGSQQGDRLLTVSGGAASAYKAAFQDYGIPLTEFLNGNASVERIEEVARRIAASPIRDWLVAALDDCASNEAALVERLLPLARRVEENNAWRRRYFDARIRSDRALGRLAKEPEALTQPPGILVKFAAIYQGTASCSDALEFFREVQRRHPADMWVNRQLAEYLPNVPGFSQDELIGYRRAALAARPESLALHFELAEDLQSADRYDEAAGVLRQVIRLKPDNINAHVQLGWSLWGQKNQDLHGAIEAYHKALALDGKHAPALLRLAVALRSKGDLVGAAAAERKVTEGEPKEVGQLLHDIGARVMLHYARARANRPPDELKMLYPIAETYLRKAIEFNPGHVAAHERLASVVQSRGDRDGAIVIYRKLIAIEPGVSRHHRVLAEVLEMSDRDEAIAAYLKAIELDFQDSMLQTKLVWLLNLKRDWDRAISIYRKAMEKNGESCQLRLGLGEALQQKGDLDGAIASFRKAVELSPLWDQPYSELAGALYAKGDLDGAIACYRKIIEVNPAWSTAYLLLAHSLAHKRDFAAAITAYEKALEKVSALQSMNLGPNGLTWYRIPQPNAKAFYVLGPALHTVLNDYAWLLATCPDAKERNPKRAVQLAGKAVQLAPNHAHYWGTLGTAHYRAGNGKEAIAALDRSRSLTAGGDAYTLLFLAMAHRKQGNPDQARKWYDQAVRWMEKNSQTLAKDPRQAEELRRIRTEAEEILELK